MRCAISSTAIYPLPSARTAHSLTFPFFEDLTFAWTAPLALSVEVNTANGDLTVAAGPANGFFSNAAGVNVLGVTGFTVKSATNSPVTVTGVLNIVETKYTILKSKA